MKLPLQNVLNQSARYLTGLAMMTSLTTTAVAFDPVTTRNCSWVAFETDVENKSEAVCIFNDGGVEKVFVGGQKANGNLFLAGYTSSGSTQKYGSQFWKDTQFANFPGEIVDFVLDSDTLYAIGYFTGTKTGLESELPGATVYDLIKSSGGGQEVIVIEFNLTDPDPEPQKVWILGSSQNDYGLSGDLSGSTLFIGGTTQSTSFEDPYLGGGVSGVYNGFIASLDISTPPSVDVVRLDGQASKATVYTGVHVYGSNVYATSNTYETDFEDPVAELIKFPVALTSATEYGIVSGNDYEELREIDIDSSGNIIVAGTTFGETAGTQENIYVASYSATGIRNWHTVYSYGTTYLDKAYGVTLDSSNNIYVVGHTQDYDSWTDVQGASEIILVKFSPTGQNPAATRYGNRAQTEGDEGTGYDVAVNSSGDAYIVGNATSKFDEIYCVDGEHSKDGRDITLICSQSDYDPGFVINESWAAFDRDSPGIDEGDALAVYNDDTFFVGGRTSDGKIYLGEFQSDDVDVTKTQEHGVLQWKDSLVGSLSGKVTDLIVDSTDLYAIGYFTGTESELDSLYPSGVVVNNETSTGGEEDILVLKYDLTGTSPEMKEIWMLGGSNIDLAEAGVLYNGSLFLVGSTFSTEFEGSSATQSASNVYNGFIASLNLTSDSVSTFFSGASTKYRTFKNICEDDSDLYVISNTADTDLDNPYSYLWRFDTGLMPDDNDFPVSINYGNDTEIWGIDASTDGSIVVAGTEFGTHNDMYIASYDDEAGVNWKAKYSHEDELHDDMAYAVAVDPDGFAYVVGETGDPENESCMLQVVYAPEGHLVSVTTYGNRGEEQEGKHTGAAYDVAVNKYGDTFLVGNATSHFDRLYTDPGTPFSKDRDICLVQSKASIFQQDGEPFYPIGFNYTRISSCEGQEEPSMEGTRFIDFMDEFYNNVTYYQNDVEADLDKMAGEGFNIVRTFLNTRRMYVDVEYMNNLVQFLDLAQSKNILVHLTTFQYPDGNGLGNIPDFETKFVSAHDSSVFGSWNYIYFTEYDDYKTLSLPNKQPALDQSVQFWTTFVGMIKTTAGNMGSEIDATAETICDNLIIEPYNEPFISIDKEPFTLSSGDLDIKYYHHDSNTTETIPCSLSNKHELAQILAKRWASYHAAEIKAVDSDILVGASPYTNYDRGSSPSHLDEYSRRLPIGSSTPFDVWKNVDPDLMDAVENYTCDEETPITRDPKRPLSYAGLLGSGFDWVGGNIYLDRLPYVERNNFKGYEKFANRRSELLAKCMLSTSFDGYGLNQPIMSAEFGYMVYLFDPLEFFDAKTIPYQSFYFDDDDMYNNAIDVNWLQTELLRRYRFRGFNYWGWDTWTRYYDPDDPGDYYDPVDPNNPIGDSQYNLDVEGFCLCDVGSDPGDTQFQYDYTHVNPYLSFDAIYGETDALLKILSPLELSGIADASIDALNTSVEDIGLVKSIYCLDPPPNLDFTNNSSDPIPVEIFFYQPGMEDDDVLTTCTVTIPSKVGMPVYRIQDTIEVGTHNVDLYTMFVNELVGLGITPPAFNDLAIGIYYISSEDSSNGLEVGGSEYADLMISERKLVQEFSFDGDQHLHLLHPGSRGEDIAAVVVTLDGNESVTYRLAAKEHYSTLLSSIFISSVEGSHSLRVESFEKQGTVVDGDYFHDDHAVEIAIDCIAVGNSSEYPIPATVDTTLSYTTTSTSDLIGYTPEIADCYTNPSVSLMGHWIEVDVPAERKLSVTSREIDLYGVAVGIYSEDGDTLLACNYSDSSTVTEATATWSNSGTATATVLILANHHAASNAAEVEIESLPINDDCADATEVFCGTSLDGWFLDGATRDGTCTCAGTLVDVWYKIEIPFSGTKVQADYTRNASFGYVALFTGSCGSLTEQDCGTLSASFTTSADDQTVYIRLSAYGVTAEQGLDITCTTPTTPSNDERASSTTIACGYSMSGVITNGASLSTSPANPCSNTTAKDVWFRYNSPAGYPSATLNQGYGPEVTIEFEDDHLYDNADGSKDYQGYIAIYEGSRLVDYRCQRTAADATGKFSLTVKLGPSMSYYIRIGSDSPSPDKYFSFSCNSKLP